jgi:hypothetical protein
MQLHADSVYVFFHRKPFRTRASAREREEAGPRPDPIPTGLECLLDGCESCPKVVA